MRDKSYSEPINESDVSYSRGTPYGVLSGKGVNVGLAQVHPNNCKNLVVLNGHTTDSSHL